MAKSKKNNKNNKPSVKVSDMAPQQDPKGGAVDAFFKITSPAAPGTVNLNGELLPAVQTTIKTS